MRLHFLSVMMLLLCGITQNNASAQTYCTPVNLSPCPANYIYATYMESMMLVPGPNSMLWTNNGCSGVAGNYVHFTANTLNVTTNDVAMIHIHPTSTDPFVAITAWADWNQDGDFDDANELADYEPYLDTLEHSAPWGHSIYVTVPPNALLGTTRMRIRTHAALTTISACDTSLVGETEDYNLNVIYACDTLPNTLDPLVVTPILCDSVINLPYYTGGLYGFGAGYQWYSAPSGSGNFTPMYFTGLQTDTVYTATDYKVVVTCWNTNISDTSNIATVNVYSQCDSVWAGDVNFDGVANNMDALWLAVGNGITGPVRTNASINWQAEYSANWSTSFLSSVNHKNADCDGNGTIDAAVDVQAVNQNYGLTHQRPAYAPNLYKTTSFPDLYVDASNVTLVPGSTVQVPIYFGTSAVQAQDVYGICGEIDIIGTTPSANPSISFSNWMNTTSTVSLSKAVSPENVHFAFARTNQSNTTSSGLLGTMEVEIPVSISGPVTFHLHNIHVINKDGIEIIDFNVVDDTAAFNPTAISTVAAENVLVAQVFPNPSKDNAQLHFSLAKASDVVLILSDITGKKHWQHTAKGIAGNQNISLPTVAPGIYFLSVTDKQTNSSKVIKWIKE